MIEQDKWIDFNDIDWNDPLNNRFNIDTRDFCAGYNFSNKSHPDIVTLNKYPDYFHTEEEIKDLLKRYFEESGGKGEWRYFDLDVNDQRVNNWQAKYLRIYREDKGFLVCNSYERAIPKEILANPVATEHLNHQ